MMTTRLLGFLLFLCAAATLADQITIQGRVTSGGKPVKGVLVAAIPHGGGLTQLAGTSSTLEDGSFVLRLEAGAYAFTATSSDFTSAYVDLPSGRVDIELSDGGYLLQGTLRGADRKPRAGRVVAARISENDGDLFVADVSANGRYSMRLPKAAYILNANAGEESITEERIDLAAETTRDLMTERPSTTTPREVTAWLKAAAIPLKTTSAGNGFADMQPIAKMVGKAHIVALGEETHGTREFFQLKHRMLEFLVERLGFTVFAIEASTPGARAINDYVLTGKGDPAKALAALGFWTWNTEEVLEMIRWMRRYNETHSTKVQFQGFDMQNPDAAVSSLFEYFSASDAGYAKALLQEFVPLTNDQQKYRSETSDHPKVLAAIEEVRRKLAAVKARDQRWKTAKHDLDLLIQAERWSATLHDTFEERDRAMAENVKWILEHEPKGTRIVLWAHNGHVSKKAASWLASGNMGSHLHRIYGSDMVVFGFAFNRGGFRAIDSGDNRGVRDQHIGEAPPGSLDAALASANLPLFVIDLRSARGPAGKWVESRLGQRSIGAAVNMKNPDSILTPVYPLQSYDALLFVNETTAARPVTGPKTPIAPAALNLTLEDGKTGGPPTGWSFSAQSEAAGFRVSIVDDGCVRGRCVQMTRAEHPPGTQGTGILAQRIDATGFRGKRIRFQAMVRSTLQGKSSTAQIWLRVDLPKGDLGFFDDMMKKPPSALPQWTKLEITGDVPPNAEAIAFGMLFLGEGTAWMDEASLEVVP